MANILKEQILNANGPYKGACWGEVCNDIQDVAWEVLPKKSLERYTKLTQRDLEECEGMDGQLFNGQYFDWREYTYRSREIVSAFLDYFTDSDLKKIAGAYQNGRL